MPLFPYGLPRFLTSPLHWVVGLGICPSATSTNPLEKAKGVPNLITYLESISSYLTLVQTAEELFAESFCPQEVHWCIDRFQMGMGNWG